MKTMSAAEFKTHCLRVMERVRRQRETVIITKKEIPIAKLVPTDEPNHDVFGCMAGTAEIRGDIEAPVVSARARKASR
jgi:antitoxin (DNA-binding transcriptional repressor) of toxin-antitoxin stability system